MGVGGVGGQRLLADVEARIEDVTAEEELGA
jgi:hypothetical protein